MGSGCTVEKTYVKHANIVSNCPVNFQYEIKETKPHPDIKVSPTLGDIVGNSTTQITFTYTPHSFSTAEAEFEVRTSEFDFKPQRVRVVGSSNP